MGTPPLTPPWRSAPNMFSVPWTQSECGLAPSWIGPRVDEMLSLVCATHLPDIVTKSESLQ